MSYQLHSYHLELDLHEQSEGKEELIKDKFKQYDMYSNNPHQFFYYYFLSHVSIVINYYSVSKQLVYTNSSV